MGFYMKSTIQCGDPPICDLWNPPYEPMIYEGDVPSSKLIDFFAGLQACAELGVDYVDTSGESTFMRRLGTPWRGNRFSVRKKGYHGRMAMFEKMMNGLDGVFHGIRPRKLPRLGWVGYGYKTPEFWLVPNKATILFILGFER